MLSRLKGLKTTHKLLLALLIILIALILVVVIRRHPQPTTLPAQPTPTASAQPDETNDDDSTVISPDIESPTIAEPTPSAQASLTPGSCHISGQLPDKACTPGAIDPRVTQDNIGQTICVAGYSRSVRPSSSITSRMKLVSMQEYGWSDSASNYEYDHLISLELGGAPQDTKNLWPEPGKSPNPKDKIENSLHKLVCTGKMLLAEAQRRIAENWTTALAGY